MRNKQLKLGAVFSYALIILNALYGFLITPYIIGQLGEVEYGVYKTIASLSSALMVLDIGIGGTVLRYVASYRAKNEEKKIPNFLFMMMVQAFSLCVLVGIVGVIICLSIGSIYSGTMDSSQVEKARQLFSIMFINVGFHIIENVINGIISGYNRFAFGNGLKLVRLMFRIALIYGLLRVIPDSVVIVLTDLSITIIFLLIEILYIHFKLGVRIRFTKWEKSVFVESGKYTLLMFLSSIAAQVNNNLDNVVIGSILGPNIVTIYSMGLLIFSTYEHLSTSVSGVMLPTVSKIIEESNASGRLERLIVKIGRVQFVLLGGAVAGFFCTGKDFIRLWLGAAFDDVYVITLILMVPSLFELCVNVCLAILRAKNKLVFRTVVLFLCTILNACITIILVKYWSYIGAAFGTATSFILGSLIIMNIYYYRVMGLNMLRIYSSIIGRIWICLIVAAIPTFVLSQFYYGRWIWFVLKVVVFVVVYTVMLVLFGLERSEVQNIPGIKKLTIKGDKND